MSHQDLAVPTNRPRLRLGRWILTFIATAASMYALDGIAALTFLGGANLGAAYEYGLGRITQLFLRLKGRRQPENL